VSIDLNKPRPEQPQRFVPPAAPLNFTPLPESYYKHSGKAPFRGMLTTLGIGISLSIVAAFAYANIIIYFPFIYFRALAPIGYPLALSFIIAFGLQMGKIRNTPVALLLSGIISFVAFYFAWTFWIFALLRGVGNKDVNLFGLLTSPLMVKGIILKIGATGYWGDKDAAISGGFLWFIWIVETVLILLAPILCGGLTASSPFCETCDRWTEEVKGIREFQCVVSEKELKKIVRRKDYGTLLTFPRRVGEPTFYRANLHSCPKCKVTKALKVEQVSLKADERGKMTETTSSIIDNLLINPSELTALRS
jgi:hypothetical protein